MQIPNVLQNEYQIVYNKLKPNQTSSLEDTIIQKKGLDLRSEQLQYELKKLIQLGSNIEIKIHNRLFADYQNSVEEMSKICNSNSVIQSKLELLQDVINYMNRKIITQNATIEILYEQNIVLQCEVNRLIAQLNDCTEITQKEKNISVPEKIPNKNATENK